MIVGPKNSNRSPSTWTEVTATYIAERHRWEPREGEPADKPTTVVGTIRLSEPIETTNEDGEPETVETCGVKGPIFPSTSASLEEGCSYRFEGRWKIYKNPRNRYAKPERQFVFTSFTPTEPAGKDGVCEYLASVARSLRVGFGEKRAAAVWERFGVDSLEAIRTKTDDVWTILAALPRLSIPRSSLDALAEELRRRKDREACEVDLLNTVGRRGIPKKSIRALVDRWGNDAARQVRLDCFRAFNGIGGVGFPKLDNLYLALGGNPKSLKRQALAAWYRVHRAEGGHTWFPRTLAEQAVESIGGVDGNSAKALRATRIAGRTAELITRGPSGAIALDVSAWDYERSNGEAVPGAFRWIADGSRAKNERDLAEIAARLSLARPEIWPNVDRLQRIDDHQRGELRKATAKAFGILGGGPGTGKTFTVASLVKYLCQTVGRESILIGAPTGKAAVRVTEAMIGNDVIGVQARTWHSHLAMLERDGADYFPAKVIIGDESSMVDTDLMAEVFRHVSSGCHVLLVGDVNQLSPVGHGAPLRDLIRAQVAYGCLTEIKRNSGGIVEACAAIREGRRWSTAENLRLHVAHDSARAVEHCLDLIQDAARRGLHPLRDVQVITALNDKGDLSRKALNFLLQAALNPKSREYDAVPGVPFYNGDKLVNGKNGSFPKADDNKSKASEDGQQIYVANGEIGYATLVEANRMFVALDSPRREIVVPFRKDGGGDSASGDEGDDAGGSLSSWDLGYAISCHKSQGSEWREVLTILDPSYGAKMVCDRAWLYTAISRARDVQHLIGARSTADAMCQRVNVNQRKTFLAELVGAEVAKIQLERM